jgi:hypothetical protein
MFGSANIYLCANRFSQITKTTTMKHNQILRVCMLVFVILVSISQTNAQQDQATFSDTIFLKRGDTIVCNIKRSDRYAFIVLVPKKDKSRYLQISYDRIRRVSTKQTFNTYAAKFEQNIDSPAYKTDHSYYIAQAGKEMILFTKNFYGGSAIACGGLALSMVGNLLILSTAATVAAPFLVIGGGLVAVVGGVYILTSYQHIRKAGEHLERAASMNQ